MLLWITGKQPMSVEHYEHHPEWVLLGEGGSLPSDFVDGKPQIEPVCTRVP